MFRTAKYSDVVSVSSDAIARKQLDIFESDFYAFLREKEGFGYLYLSQEEENLARSIEDGLQGSIASYERGLSPFPCMHLSRTSSKSGVVCTWDIANRSPLTVNMVSDNTNLSFLFLGEYGVFNGRQITMAKGLADALRITLETHVMADGHRIQTELSYGTFPRQTLTTNFHYLGGMKAPDGDELFVYGAKKPYVSEEWPWQLRLKPSG